MQQTQFHECYLSWQMSVYNCTMCMQPKDMQHKWLSVLSYGDFLGHEGGSLERPYKFVNIVHY